MIRSLTLTALLLTACGGATGDELFDAAETAATSAPASSAELPETEPAAEPTRTARAPSTPAPRTPAPEPAPEFRTCREDADCELRESSCLPLSPGDAVRFCREPLSELGAACEIDTDCEAGLHCWVLPGEHARECLSGPGRTPRAPLACDRVGAENVQDVGCELTE